MIDRQRQVGCERLADRLAVLPALRHGEHLQVLLHGVGDCVEYRRALGRRGASPACLGSVGGVERELDILWCGVRDLAERLSGDGGEVGAILTAARRDPLAADEVLVA